ncbi:hypothetical protein SAY87_012166 [Trapa incisa]|uniref:Zinc finger PHD-type domain-containing protein n=1 Tax=Trapa incisa TaxID=236973 RepID=A0AAN7JIN9_9MYRT|nr:hypothetical protein SAY87_012166 [Trapa incisa]
MLFTFLVPESKGKSLEEMSGDNDEESGGHSGEAPLALSRLYRICLLPPKFDCDLLFRNLFPSVSDLLKTPAMDVSKLRCLPPAKRFSAMLRNLDNGKNVRPTHSHIPLPTKKRKKSRYFGDSVMLEPSNTSTITYCLPAKKRVWIPQPDSEFPFSAIDLNVVYKLPLPPPRPTHHPPSVDDEETGGESKFLCECSKLAHEIAHGEAEKTKEVDVKGAEDEDDAIVRAICQSTDGDPKDPIVFCNGCDLMVHTSCYGNPLVHGIPKGDWFCNQCFAGSKVEGTDSLSCCLCPMKGGALKSTVDGGWAHVVCALFVPEGGMVVPSNYSELKCPLSFHVICGFSEYLSIEYREGKGKGDIIAGFCKAHTNIWDKQQQTGKFRIVAREEEG